MHHLLVALATTPSPLPTPSLREGVSEDQITPGLWGFIMTAFFVLATTLLIVDMVRRIRRVRYRAQVEEERQAAAAAADMEAADAHDGLAAPESLDAPENLAAPESNASTEGNGQGAATDRSQPRD